MVEARRIRVMVADHHAVVRTGLSVALQVHPDLELVGEATNGTEALEICARTQPDVVLMDLIMPGVNGVKATRAIHRAYPRVQIIILSSFGNETLAKAAIRAGAATYLSKDVTGEELATAIRSAYLPPGLMR